jgi:phosphotransferase system HPr-like phosphotransfer protein
MAACMKQGSEIVICCDGEQEAECLTAAVDFVESGLGE